MRSANIIRTIETDNSIIIDLYVNEVALTNNENMSLLLHINLHIRWKEICHKTKSSVTDKWMMNFLHPMKNILARQSHFDPVQMDKTIRQEYVVYVIMCIPMQELMSR